MPPEFDSCTLYLGGDVGENALNIIHGVPDVEHSVQVVPGVYLGGIEGVRDALSSGRARTDDIKLLTRYSGWAPRQLDDEVSQGVWIPVAASRQLILSPWAAMSGVELWHAIMQLMGGEFAQLSAAVRGECDEEIMGLGGGGGGDGASKKPSPQSDSSASEAAAPSAGEGEAKKPWDAPEGNDYGGGI